MADLGEESSLLRDPRLHEAVRLFNAGDWYDCHDALEELWHETGGPMRVVLQAILQIAVAQLHLERGNQRGATMLMGEGLGRLNRADEAALGLDLHALRQAAQVRLKALQVGEVIGSQADPPLQLLPDRSGDAL